MSDNMPILWQNALMQFGTEVARKAWIWFVETRGDGMQYAADAYASEVDRLCLSLRPMLNAAAKTRTGGQPRDLSGEVIDDLLRFVLLRHANYRLGGNVHPTFLREA